MSNGVSHELSGQSTGPKRGTITVANYGYVFTGIIIEEVWTDDSSGLQTTPNRLSYVCLEGHVM